MARVLRDGEQLAEVEVLSVKRQSQEAKEVFEGEMCGLQLKPTSKLQLEENDRLEFYKQEEIERTL